MTMIEYHAETDELRRAHALDEALRNAELGTEAELVIRDAMTFEAYLKGTPTSVRFVPMPEEERNE